MPEQRARKYHQERVAETLREEIGAMIEGELSDPRIRLCTVSEVALNPGGKSARVYIAVEGLDKLTPDEIVTAEKETIAGLEAANGFINITIKARMGVRHVPDLTFLADRSERFTARIDDLLGRAEKRKKKSAVVAAE
jgi:ribosome-binding factor A